MAGPARHRRPHGGRPLERTWLPRAALLSGATSLLLLAAINPDAWVAQRNIDRYEETGTADWSYLQQLSDDAVPVLATLPDDVVECALYTHTQEDDDWLEWNLGRHRAQPYLDDLITTWDYDSTFCQATSD